MQPAKHTLLVVDDEVDVLDSIRHQLHRSYRVLTSISGSEAIQILERDEVSLILTDQRMPGMTGDLFLRRARQLKPDAIRMLFTGYADIQAVISAVNEGNIFRYILKPWDTVELESILRQGVEQYELLAERRRLIGELQEANTLLTRANLELARAGRLKTAFIEVASHEFNTPITLVQGLTELLRMSDSGRPQAENEILRQISSSGRQLARLVTNMMTLLQAEDFRRMLQTRLHAVAEVIAAAVDQVRPFSAARGQTIALALADDLGRFEVDRDKIHAVLINLLTNAIKFTPDKGTIRISAGRERDGAIVIEVDDQGAGIEAGAGPHLFQPFFTQLDPSRHSSGDFGYCKRGLGLGLCIARQFVEMHGGSIEGENRPDGGARFRVRLPAAGASGPAGSSSSDRSLCEDANA